jgi:hypothetical protein
MASDSIATMTRMLSLAAPIRWALRKAGIDGAVAYGLLGRSLQILARPVNLLLMVLFLTVEEQGFQYTFASVLGLKIFFELGLGLVVLQFTGHEAAKLTWTPGGTLDGDPAAKGRLGSLLRLTALAYGLIGGLFALIILPVGWLFFSLNGGAEAVSWKAAWVWTVAVTTVSLPLGGLGAILHGCGRIKEIARVNFAVSAAQAVANWGFLAAGLGLLAAPAGVTVAVAVQVWGTVVCHHRLLLDLWRRPPDGARVSWGREVWPLQWKIAISWLSSYFISQLFTPLAFAFYGATAAAQIGLSLAVVNLLLGIGWTWVGTNLPVLTAYVAQQRYAQLDQTFFRLLAQSTAVVISGAVAAVVATVIIQTAGWPVGGRLVPWVWMVVAVLAGICWHLIDCMGGYLNCFRQDPFLVVKLVCAIVTAPTVFLVCKYIGPYWMLPAYLGVSAVLGLGLGFWLFQTKRREWQSLDDCSSDEHELPLLPAGNTRTAAES